MVPRNTIMSLLYTYLEYIPGYLVIAYTLVQLLVKYLSMYFNIISPSSITTLLAHSVIFFIVLYIFPLMISIFPQTSSTTHFSIQYCDIDLLYIHLKIYSKLLNRRFSHLGSSYRRCTYIYGLRSYASA